MVYSTIQHSFQNNVEKPLNIEWFIELPEKNIPPGFTKQF